MRIVAAIVLAGLIGLAGGPAAAFGGHNLSTSHVGFDFAGGVSLLTASNHPPDYLQVDPAARTYALHTHHDATLTFVPGGRGAFDCAIRYRPLFDNKAAGGVRRKAGRFVFDTWGGRYADIARGLHDNYIDFYPDAEGYSYDHVCFTAAGEPPGDGVTFRVWAGEEKLFERHTASKKWQAGRAAGDGEFIYPLSGGRFAAIVPGPNALADGVIAFGRGAVSHRRRARPFPPWGWTAARSARYSSPRRRTGWRSTRERTSSLTESHWPGPVERRASGRDECPSDTWKRSWSSSRAGSISR